MSEAGGKKSSWQELLYVPATPAVMAIAKERPDVAVEVIPPGSRVDPTDPYDFNPKRVRVFFDNHGFVSRVPAIG